MESFNRTMNRFLVIFIVGLLLQAPWAARSDAPVHYTVTDLGPLPNIADDVAMGLNDGGQVSLWVKVGPAVHAEIWQGGSVVDLGVPSGYLNSIAHDINSHGRVVGWMNTTANPVDSLGTVRAFDYDGSQLRLLGTLGGRDSQAFAIDDDGRIVGVAMLKNGEHHAFLCVGGAIADLGTLPGGSYSVAYAINRSGDIVGAADAGHGFKHAVLWRTPSRRGLRSSGSVALDLGILPTGSTSSARAINNKDEVVGFADTDHGFHAFLYSEGRMQDLGTLGSDPSEACGINDHGEIVGASNIVRYGRHGFVWEDGQMTDLNTLIPQASGWTILRASSVNNAGQIACVGRHGGGEEHALLLNPTN